MRAVFNNILCVFAKQGQKYFWLFFTGISLGIFPVDVRHQRMLRLHYADQGGWLLIF